MFLYYVLRKLQIEDLIVEKILIYPEIRQNCYSGRRYYHLWSKSFDEIDEDALRCLGNMSRLASNHFELFSDRDNINKIKEYTKASSASDV
jgi:hypothetical protein